MKSLLKGLRSKRHLSYIRHLLFLLLAVTFIIPAITAPASRATVAVSITIAPPAIPVYEQPPCPEEGYIWTPGYWAWGPGGYYWVPGVWVAPPHVGLLWTPGYWAFAGGAYVWHAGYWGPHVGFYGGINYGWGYPGVGFVGGVWDGPHFRYNTAVVHVSETRVHNVYIDRAVIHEHNVTRISYNGGHGVHAVPTVDERHYMHEHHYDRTPEQFSHQTWASRDHGQWSSENHGSPHNAAFGSVNDRQVRQQERIARGVHSEQMTPRETAHVEHQEARIHDEIRNDRATNGGHLTPQEHHEIDRQQNQMSREIYRDKHNDRTDAHPHGGGHDEQGHR